MADNTLGSRLLTIPPELFERITTFADPAALRNLRLVCREANDKTLREYTKVSFAERECLVADERSLKRLLAISQHERFGRSLRTVTFNVAQIKREFDDLTLTQRSKGKQKKEAQDLQKLNKAARNRRKFVYVQQQFWEREGALPLLTTAFSCFRTVGNAPVVEISAASGPHSEATRTQTLEKARGQPLGLYAGDSRPVRTVLRALELSALNVQELRIIHVGVQIWDELLRRCPPIPHEGLRNLFAGLSSLNIVLDHAIDSPREVTTNDLERMAELMSGPGLHELALSPLPCSQEACADSRLSRLLGKLFTRTFAKLAVFSVSGALVNTLAAIRFMDRHPRLRETSVTRCTLRLDKMAERTMDQSSRKWLKVEGGGVTNQQKDVERLDQDDTTSEIVTSRFESDDAQVLSLLDCWLTV